MSDIFTFPMVRVRRGPVRHRMPWEFPDRPRLPDMNRVVAPRVTEALTRWRAARPHLVCAARVLRGQPVAECEWDDL